MKNKFLFSLIALMISMFCGAQDIIITTNAQKIEAKITEVSKSEIKYKEFDNLDGPTFILETADINSIIYSNGKVTLFDQPAAKQEPAQQPVSATPEEPRQDLNLARVANYSGVFVFTDCTPVSQYEILGDVYFDKEGKRHVAALPMYGYSNGSMHVTGTQVLSYSETPQYTDIRDGLIAQAVMANRQVEGVILSLPKAGEGRATLIKFKENVEDKSLARVNSHLGVLVFTDCMPVNTYSFVGKIDKAGGNSADYSNIRDRLIKKAQKKFSIVQGIIPRFVIGSYDTAEAIRF